MSVVPVCCPLRLHAVSPCLIANTFTFALRTVKRCWPPSGRRTPRHVSNRPRVCSTTGGQRSSPHADRPQSHRVLPGQMNFFSFVTDHNGFALTVSVLDILMDGFVFLCMSEVSNGMSN